MNPPRGSNDERFEEKLQGAFNRNGLNTLLLDIKEGLGSLSADMKHVIHAQDAADKSRTVIHERLNGISEQVALLDAVVARIEPKVNILDTERTERIGRKKLYGSAAGLLTKGRLAVAGLTGGGLGTWAYWDWIRDHAAKLIGKG